MPNIKIINPLDYPGWDDLLLENGSRSIFHTTGWALVLVDSYGYTPFYFTEINDGKLSTLIPLMEIDSFLTGKRGVSLPFTDFCPLIISEDTGFGQIFETVVDFGRKRKWKTIELRSDAVGSLGNVSPSETFKTHNLELKNDHKEISAGFRSSTKRNIRKARNEEIEITLTHSSESLEEFVRLNGMTRRQHGLPPQPNALFHHIFNHIISKDRGLVVLAFHNAKAIAGAIFFYFGKEADFKYGASNKEYLHLRPNNLVMWKAIEHFAESGFRSLSFGRTELHHKGLAQFKNGWGTKEDTATYYKYDLGKDIFITSQTNPRSSYNILKALPIPLLRLIGRLLYRHIG